MPELPEVEVTRRALAPYVEGATVRRLVVRDRRLRWPVPAQLPRLVAGRRLLALDRRGKYLLWRFEGGTMISHLGMSGSWRVHLAAAPPPNVHDHADLIVDRDDRACVARLTDPRRFGALLWHRARDGDVERHPLLAHLGVEPFDARFTGRLIHEKTRGRAASIKQVLLAGDIVVGVGNIYASESLFRAGIDPRLPAGRLGPARCDALADAVRATLEDAIRVGGSTLRDFVGADGTEGYFMLDAYVYGRDGAACKRCGARVRRLLQGQRTTYYCPGCQRR